MFRQPFLGTTNDRIRVGLPAHKASIRQLPFGVPLQQINLGNTQGFTRAAMARNDVNCKIVPRGRAAGGNDTSPRIRKYKIGLGIEAHFWKLFAEQVFVSPMGRRLTPVGVVLWKPAARSRSTPSRSYYPRDDAAASPLLSSG